MMKKALAPVMVMIVAMAAISSAGAQLIGGGGYYCVSSSLAGGTGASNHAGFNIGGGLNLPLLVFKGFAEARYNHVSTSGGSTSFVPITVGLMF